MAISSNEFIHPEDDAARRQLESIPGFGTVVKTFLRLGFEQMLHGTNMANKIRLSPRQLPELHHKLPPLCRKLGIAEPEFYLEMDPRPNAYTYGDTRVAITVTSGLLEHLEANELEAVIAHECGHVACHHVLYRTMADFLVMGASGLGLLDTLLIPVRLALLYWSRRSEFSADRAAATVIGSPGPVVDTMIRLSGGPKSLTSKVDLEEYVAQAEAYDQLLASQWDKLLQGLAVMGQSHPFPAVRAREIRKWAEGERFERLVAAVKRMGEGGACPGCGDQTDPAWKFCENCGEEIK